MGRLEVRLLAGRGWNVQLLYQVEDLRAIHLVDITLEQGAVHRQHVDLEEEGEEEEHVQSCHTSY